MNALQKIYIKTIKIHFKMMVIMMVMVMMLGMTVTSEICRLRVLRKTVYHYKLQKKMKHS